MAIDVHIGDAFRREIRSRDWTRVHVEADRRRPIVLPDLRLGRWS